MQMSQKWLKAPLFAVLWVFCALWMTGCTDEKKLDRKPSRTKDPVYQQQLKDSLQEQKQINKARFAVERELEAVVAQARAALPKDATDEQVKAELDGHPEKYPTWKKLHAKAEEGVAAHAASVKKARDLVRARILKDTAGAKSVVPQGRKQ